MDSISSWWEPWGSSWRSACCWSATGATKSRPLPLRSRWSTPAPCPHDVPGDRALLRTGGIVLCGGQSKRMGRPKAWLPFAGEIMLPRVVRLLDEAVKPIVVVAAPGQDVPPLPPTIQIVRDEEKGRGPLQGLAAGLAALAGRADAAYLSSCDVPFLRPGFVQRLRELLGEHAICVPRVGDYHHPLAAVYRLEVRETVSRL